MIEELLGTGAVEVGFLRYMLDAGSEITRRNPADGPQITQICADGG